MKKILILNTLMLVLCFKGVYASDNADSSSSSSKRKNPKGASEHIKEVWLPIKKRGRQRYIQTQNQGIFDSSSSAHAKEPSPVSTYEIERFTATQESLDSRYDPNLQDPLRFLAANIRLPKRTGQRASFSSGGYHAARFAYQPEARLQNPKQADAILRMKSPAEATRIKAQVRVVAKTKCTVVRAGAVKAGAKLQAKGHTPNFVQSKIMTSSLVRQDGTRMSLYTFNAGVRKSYQVPLDLVISDPALNFIQVLRNENTSTRDLVSALPFAERARYKSHFFLNFTESPGSHASVLLRPDHAPFILSLEADLLVSKDFQRGERFNLRLEYHQTGFLKQILELDSSDYPLCAIKLKGIDLCYLVRHISSHDSPRRFFVFFDGDCVEDLEMRSSQEIEQIVTDIHEIEKLYQQDQITFNEASEVTSSQGFLEKVLTHKKAQAAARKARLTSPQASAPKKSAPITLRKSHYDPIKVLSEIASMLDRSPTRSLRKRYSLDTHPEWIPVLEEKARDPRNWYVLEDGYYLNLGIKTSLDYSQTWALNLEKLTGTPLTTDHLRYHIPHLYQSIQIESSTIQDKRERTLNDRRQDRFFSTLPYKGSNKVHGIKLPGFVMSEGTSTLLNHKVSLPSYESKNGYKFRTSYVVTPHAPQCDLMSSVLISPKTIAQSVRLTRDGASYPLQTQEGIPLYYANEPTQISWGGKKLTVQALKSGGGQETDLYLLNPETLVFVLQQ